MTDTKPPEPPAPEDPKQREDENKEGYTAPPCPYPDFPYRVFRDHSPDPEDPWNLGKLGEGIDDWWHECYRISATDQKSMAGKSVRVTHGFRLQGLLEKCQEIVLSLKVIGQADVADDLMLRFHVFFQVAAEVSRRIDASADGEITDDEAVQMEIARDYCWTIANVLQEQGVVPLKSRTTEAEDESKTPHVVLDLDAYKKWAEAHPEEAEKNRKKLTESFPFPPIGSTLIGMSEEVRQFIRSEEARRGFARNSESLSLRSAETDKADADAPGKDRPEDLNRKKDAETKPHTEEPPPPQTYTMEEIERSFGIYRTPEARFTVTDRHGTRTLIVPAGEPTWSGDPTGPVLDWEAHTRTRLKDGGNPAWYLRLKTHFLERRDPHETVTFAEFVKARHPDKIDVFPPPGAGEAKTPERVINQGSSIRAGEAFLAAHPEEAEKIRKSLKETASEYRQRFEEIAAGLGASKREYEEGLARVARNIASVGPSGTETDKPNTRAPGKAWPKDPITTAVAVATFHVSRTTLSRYVAEGKIKAYRPPGAPRNGKIVYSKKALASCFPAKKQES